MQKKTMNGKTLLNAAKIIAKTGEQLEGMIEIIENKLIEEFELMESDNGRGLRVEIGANDPPDAGYQWLLQAYLFNLHIYEGKRKTASGSIAVQIILYDEEDMEIPGWEPSLSVMYQSGDVAFEIGNFSLSNLIEEGCVLESNRLLWRWEEAGWGFAVPLVQLNSEEDIAHQIIEPVKKLYNKIEATKAFPADSIAFQFEIDGDMLRIIEEE